MVFFYSRQVQIAICLASFLGIFHCFLLVQHRAFKQRLFCRRFPSTIRSMKRVPPALKLLFWIGLVWGCAWILSELTSIPELHWLPVMLVGIGIFVLLERPFVSAGYSGTLETGIAAICGVIFTLYLAWVLLIPRLNEEAMMSQPCSPRSLELQCYTFSQENCSAVWEHYSKDCTEEIKREILSRRSTALTGPLVKRCIYKRLDQAFHSNRRTPINLECTTFFNSLDSQPQ